MRSKQTFTSLLSLSVILGLAGCVSSNGGGGGDDFETKFDTVKNTVVTTDMPTRLAGTYKGQMKLGVNSGSTDLLGAGIDPQLAEVLGDVAIKVDWTDGMTTNPFTGKADNFTVTEAGTSKTAKLDGSLTVDTSKPGTLSRVSTPATKVKGYTVPARDTGTFTMMMTGQIGTEDKMGDVFVQLGGNFHGKGADAMLGTVNEGIKATDSTNPSIADAGLGGVFYAERQ